MKFLFENRIYNSLCSITISYGVIAIINSVMAKTGYWLTSTQNHAMNVAALIAVGAVMSGLQYFLFRGLTLPEVKLFSKATFLQTAAVVFVLIIASMFADMVTYFYAFTRVGFAHYALMVAGVLYLAPRVSAFMSKKGFIHEFAFARG
ncbi:hypothetical protein [Pseudomonas baetica]|uniref:hypothetical protein n=1 Tax=Pseudomonas baetica TaxID=674054 RepID=UPI002405CB10|nr:hypothetical protein [Pseudomonas baetica]MDF9778989.1 magnesium-transporting ATPase (P-type) [Pseudomonas baetica]